MKLQPDKFDVQSISGYGPGWLALDNEKIISSLIISSQGQRLEWPCRSFADLTPAHFEQIATLDAELVIFGSGGRIHFPHPLWLRPLMARRIGVETMDTQAACRTYNILAGEGRHVVAALLLEVPG
ncbi:MAG: Mth938-like domain-containing protein [Rhodoferax sp.]